MVGLITMPTSLEYKTFKALPKAESLDAMLNKYVAEGYRWSGVIPIGDVTYVVMERDVDVPGETDMGAAIS